MSKSHRSLADHGAHLIADIRKKQKNTVWPDALRNSRSIDEFLWKGSFNPPLVQRIGAWLIGSSFILLGLAVLILTATEGLSLATFLGAGATLLGAKVFFNGFPKPHKGKRHPTTTGCSDGDSAV